MLTAISQSLTTTAAEVTVNVADTDDTTTTVRIPSFIYLENRLEQIEANLSALWNMPQSGEAWMTKDADMYKLQFVKTSSAPATPVFSTENMYASTKPNYILKDMVSPQTYLRFDITNLTDNISQIFMKKIVVNSDTLFNTLSGSGMKTYEQVKEALFNAQRDVDYEEYDKILDMPVKRDEFISRFRILEIPQLDSGNPWIDNSVSDDGKTHRRYKLRLDTITYTDQDDSSIAFTLKAGDYVCLQNQYNIYKVLNVAEINTDAGLKECNVVLEERLGHIALQTFEQNQNMVLELYNKDYDKYHYVDVPLEENPYIVIFLGTIQNNVRSVFSDAVFVNLNEIYMRDENGSPMYYEGAPMTYMQYYNNYCKNLGDLMLGLTQTAFPQISNYSAEQLSLMENSQVIKGMVTDTISGENILAVKKINQHLVDDETTNNILKLHEEKSEINSQLSTLQDNIDQIYNQLTTTDFNQELNVTQESLRSQLTQYYNQRIVYQKQLIAVIDNINSLRGDAKGVAQAKYRVRGVSAVTEFLKAIKSMFNKQCDIIGMDVEYKYKSVSSDTNNVTSINGTIFTDWIKYPTIERERKILFNEDTGAPYIEFENYDGTNNIIKWNQLDIPINQGEDVVIRVRYKYCVGQPFIDLYTPWSDTVTVSFPAEFEEDTQLSTVLSTNSDDTVTAAFNSTLINEGYEEHISNKLVDNSQTFYHMPENIYSGFTTPENKLISLKDKLNEMENEITQYKAIIENELNAEYKVYLTWDNNTVELNNNTENTISINESLNGSTDTFVRKEMNIVIKNTGSIPINFYSIFPGNVEIPLLLDTNQFYEKYIVNYERVPIMYGTSQTPITDDDKDSDGNVFAQTLGQWIYFRQNNPYTGVDIYFDDEGSYKTNGMEDADPVSGVPKRYFSKNIDNYINKDKKQAMLSSRGRFSENYLKWSTWTVVSQNGSDRLAIESQDDHGDYDGYTGNTFIYKNSTVDVRTSEFSNLRNNWLLLYENVAGYDGSKPVYLSPNQSVEKFISAYKPKSVQGSVLSSAQLNGAFLIPRVLTKTDLLCPNDVKNQYIKLDVGKSLSIPVVFEYFLDGVDNTSITKTLCFDLRSTILQDPEHYILNVSGKYDFSGNNSDLQHLGTLYDSLVKN